MKIDKRFALAGLAVAVTMFAAVSASPAAAAVWKDKGVNVSKLVTIGLTGGEVSEAGAKGLTCSLAATLTTEGGSTGKITKLTTTNCTGFGELTGCKVALAEAKGLPWTVDVNATDLTITGWHTRRTFQAGCATSEIDKTVGSVTVTLNTPAAITEMEFLGEIAGYKTFGSFTVDAPNSGTYGIG